MDIKFAPAGVMPEAPEKIARKSAKRKIQVDRAATLFESGKKYTETEVNILLMQLFEGIKHRVAEYLAKVKAAAKK